MEYKFKSNFDRNKVYVIETESDLSKYDTFTLSVRKDDSDWGGEPICRLSCSNVGKLGGYSIILNSDNFDEYYTVLNTFKNRKCVKMGEALQNVTVNYVPKDKISIDTQLTSLKDCNDSELLNAFYESMKTCGLIDNLFTAFCMGYKHGEKKTHK